MQPKMHCLGNKELSEFQPVKRLPNHTRSVCYNSHDGDIETVVTMASTYMTQQPLSTYERFQLVNCKKALQECRLWQPLVCVHFGPLSGHFPHVSIR